MPRSEQAGLISVQNQWTYLGDGVYYFVPDYDQIVLFTWNGEEIKEIIHLDGEMLATLHSNEFGMP